jgi:hypothetical protein
MPTTYDPKCEELARHFLGDDAKPELIAALCRELQATVETFMEFEVGDSR